MSDSNQNSHLSHLISPHSVSVYGESVGHSSVTDEAITTLSYDVTHRLYELLKECRTEMNVYRQTKMSTTILNNVFKNYGIPPLYGNKFLVPYMSIPNSDMSVLHLTKVDVLDESRNDTVNVEIEPTPFVKGIYVSPLTKICGIMNLVKSLDTMSADILPKTEPKSECEIDNLSNTNVQRYNTKIKNENFTNDKDLIAEVESINRIESDYYLIVAQVVLNSPECLFKIVLEDLRYNPRLGNVYPSLLNLISNSIKSLKCSGNLIDKILRTIEALLDNNFVDPSPYHSVDEAMNALCGIILEPKMASDCDDFPHRMHASYLLMRALNTWNVTVEEKKKILVTIKKALMYPEKMSLKLNYSVLLMFYSLGCDNLDAHFWPLLNKYLNVLCSLDEIISGKRSILLTTDICHVKSALMLVAGILYRNFWNDDPSIQQLHMEADMLLCSYFGEGLSPIRTYALLKSSEIFTNFSIKSKQRTSKDAVVDTGKNYRNIQLYAFRKKFTPSYSNLSNKPKMYHAIDEVFDVSLKYPKNRAIIFNFIGSNQITQLRDGRLDNRYNIQFMGSRRNQTFLKYEKTTRCIKYCNTSKNCSGDIFLFL